VEETVAELHGDAVRLIRFVPHGLDDHQDVFAFQRAGLARRPVLSAPGSSGRRA
jgi:hypothetical protein